jgi:CRP-like cAMP-binding protein
MDENYLLTLAELSLEKDLVRGVSIRGVFALRRSGSTNHILIDDVQYAVLEAFATPQTVPHMLTQAILVGNQVSLSEFYELILKACRAGILTPAAPIGDPRSAAAESARDFPFLSSAAIGFGLVGLTLFATAALARPPTQLPGWEALVIGWVALSCALSVGALWATVVLKATGARPGDAVIYWKTILPRMRVDLRDAHLRPPSEQFAVAIAHVTPAASLAAFALAAEASWSLLPVCGMLIGLAPHSRIVDAIRLLFGETPRLDTERAFVFSANRLPYRRLRAILSFDNRPYLLQFFLGVAWLLLVFQIGYPLIGLNLLDVVVQPSFPLHILLGSAGVFAATSILAFLGLALFATWRRGRRAVVRLVRRLGRWRAMMGAVLSEKEIQRVINDSALFRALAPADRLGLSNKMGIACYHAWEVVYDPSDHQSPISLIARGSARTFHKGSDGRRHPVQPLIEGDLIGAQTLLEPNLPALPVESRTPLITLTLDRRQFEEDILQRLGLQRVERLTHVCSFLRSTPLCRGWNLSAIIRLCELVDIRRLEAGARVASFGMEPIFTIVWSGECEVIRQGAPDGFLNPGQHYGEAELLTARSLSVDIITRKPTRILVVPRSEFLRFVTHNHGVALAIERIASQRLRQPVFPVS